MDGPSDTEGLDDRIATGRRLYSQKNYKSALEHFESCLSDATATPKILAELHLFIAKCFKSQDNLQQAIQSCNSAIHNQPKWKDPYLYRSACFQALQTFFLETAGDLRENIDKDRQQADIIVNANASDAELRDGKVVRRIDEALKLAKDGDNVFVEAGEYEVTSRKGSSSSYFLCGKRISLIGASTKDCVLLYRRKPGGTGGPKESRLETFLICTSEGPPTLIKRLTFRNLNHQQSVRTKFLGVAGGSVQLEDCLFDGVECSEVDAVYTSSKICGSLATNYPPPHVIVRFCVFDHCQSFGAITAMRAKADIRCCYFVGCGRCGVSAMDSAAVVVDDCEFAQTERSEQTLSATGSEMTVNGCYIHGIQTSPLGWARNAQAVSIMNKSVARVTDNYVYRTGNGVICIDSDLVCANNMILNCSKKYSEILSSSAALSSSDNGYAENTLGLYTGLSVKHKAKLQIADNLIARCDVAVYTGKGAMPAVKGNRLESSFFTGVFAECSSRPNIMGNTFNGGAAKMDGKGLGILMILEAGGLIGKNVFEEYVVSPVMVFSTCHPLVKGNEFADVVVDAERQKHIEKNMLEQFHSELFQQDQYFYVVDSEENEKNLQEVIFKGNPNLKKQQGS